MQTWQEADQELAERVRKFRYKNPHISYEAAQRIVLDEDSILAGSYSGVESPRTAAIRKEFALDRKLRDGTSEAPDLDSYQYRCAVAEDIGWREASNLYGIDVEREIIEKLKRQIMDLENQQIQYQNIIDNFPEEERQQQQKVDTLQQQLGTRTGYVPTVEEVKKEQDKLLALGREHAIAEEELPHVEKELDALRKKLDKLESGKKFSRQKRYPSPSHELRARAERYAREYKVDYEVAAIEILEEDEILSTAYNLYSVDELLGLNDQQKPVIRDGGRQQEKSYDGVTTHEAGSMLSERAVKRQRETGEPYDECFKAEGEADPELYRIYTHG
jgi:hypothetical protein